MKVSVIIPCYNGADTIAVQLEALANQEWSGPWEVIVADNGSTDQSRAIVEQYRTRFANIRVVEASERRGGAYARNVGVRASTGEAILFCDVDDEVAPGWLAAMAEALTTHDFVACRLDTEKLNAPWQQQMLGNPQRDGLQKLHYPPYLFHAGGSTLGVKRKVFDALGGFDDTYRYLIDTEFCCRVQLAGCSFYFVSDAVVHYRYRATFGGIYRQARNWGEWNIYLYKKYKPAGHSELWRWKMYVDDWKRLLWLLPTIYRKGRLAEFLFVLGWQMGRLRGTLKHRVAPV